MLLRILYYAGIIAAITLGIACFLPWVYYADLNETFTGFYSFRNEYGRPGRLLFPLAVIALVLMLLPRIWAKRVNLFVCGLAVGYAIKTFILFTSCYNAYCPEKLPAIYLVLIASFVMLAAAILPDIKLGKANEG